MRLLLAALILALVSPEASAALITYNFKGYVIGSFGVFSDASSDSAVSGTFSIDDQLLDLRSGDASTDRFQNYWQDSPALSNSFAATISFGSHSFDLGPNRRGSLEIDDGVCFPQEDCDAVLFNIFGGDVGTLRLGAVDIISPFVGVYSTAVAEGASNLTDTMAGAISILDHLDPSAFNQWEYGWSSFRLPFVPGVRNDMYFRWTEISRASVAVPEPATMLLFGAGLFGIGVMRRRRGARAFGALTAPGDLKLPV